MGASIDLKVISPTRTLLCVDAVAMTLPGAFGYMTILPGHTSMVSEISFGELRIVDHKGKSVEYLISGGYLECNNTSATVLAETIECLEEIDLERAKQARQRASERLKSAENDLQRAQRALERADARIRLATRDRG